MTRKIKGSLKEIHFVTGKGGVGKSTAALALAFEIARSGKKTLLAEIGDRSFYTYFLEAPVVYKPSPVIENLEVAHWSAEECLKSYALSLLKVEALYKLFFQNPVSRSLIQVAPSLPELSVMGQITSAPRQHGPHGDHEVLVVDSYATGHFLNLVRAPAAMGATIQMGPMGEQSRQMQEILKDSGLCHVHIVTTAEELPMTETDELMRTLKDEMQWPAHIILNRYLSSPIDSSVFSENESQILLKALRDKFFMQERAVKKFRSEAESLRLFPLRESLKNLKDIQTLLKESL